MERITNLVSNPQSDHMIPPDVQHTFAEKEGRYKYILHKRKKVSRMLLIVTCYSLLPSYTQTTWIACLTVIVCKLVGVNICGQSVSIIDVNYVFQYVVGIYRVTIALSIQKYSILTSNYIIHSYTSPCLCVAMLFQPVHCHS